MKCIEENNDTQMFDRRVRIEEARKGFELFCGNLTKETNEADLIKYFQKYGDLSDYMAMKNGNSKRRTHFGFVSFEKEEDREKALADGPHKLNGNEITLEKASGKANVRSIPEDFSAKGDPESPVMRKIYVGGLQPQEEMETLEEEVKTHFGKYGTIEDFVCVADTGIIFK